MSDRSTKTDDRQTAQNKGTLANLPFEGIQPTSSNNSVVSLNHIVITIEKEKMNLFLMNQFQTVFLNTTPVGEVR